MEEQKQQEAAEAARKAAVDGLASMCSEPLLLWQAAVRLVKSYTSAASVYVANIVDEEQPEWTPPEDPEADVETDDEDAAAAAADGDTGGEADDGEAAQEDAAAEGEDADGEIRAADGADGAAGKCRIRQPHTIRSLSKQNAALSATPQPHGAALFEQCSRAYIGLQEHDCSPKACCFVLVLQVHQACRTTLRSCCAMLQPAQARSS